MHPKRALCGRYDVHESHYVMPQDYYCPGLGPREAAAGALLLILEQYLRDHHGKVPDGTTLLMHPTVRYALYAGLDYDYQEFLQEKADAFPLPEIPAIVTTVLKQGEWRLVTISTIRDGIMPE